MDENRCGFAYALCTSGERENIAIGYTAARAKPQRRGVVKDARLFISLRAARLFALPYPPPLTPDARVYMRVCVCVRFIVLTSLSVNRKHYISASNSCSSVIESNHIGVTRFADQFSNVITLK